MCFRFYPNMSAKFTIRDKEGMESWLAYNKEWRPGNALFIDGVHIDNTGFTDKKKISKIQEWYESVKDDYKRMPVFIIGKQREFLGGQIFTRNGYPDDVEIFFSKEGTIRYTLT